MAGWGAGIGAALQSFGEGFNRTRQQAIENALQQKQQEEDERYKSAVLALQRQQEARMQEQLGLDRTQQQATIARQRDLDALAYAKSGTEGMRLPDDLYNRIYKGTGSEQFFAPDQTLPSTQFMGTGGGQNQLDEILRSASPAQEVPGYHRMTDLPAESKAALEQTKATNRMNETMRRLEAQRYGVDTRADTSRDNALLAAQTRAEIAGMGNQLGQVRNDILRGELNRKTTADATINPETQAQQWTAALNQARQIVDDDINALTLPSEEREKLIMGIAARILENRPGAPKPGGPPPPAGGNPLGLTPPKR